MNEPQITHTCIYTQRHTDMYIPYTQVEYIVSVYISVGIYTHMPYVKMYTCLTAYAYIYIYRDIGCTFGNFFLSGVQVQRVHGKAQGRLVVGSSFPEGWGLGIEVCLLSSLLLVLLLFFISISTFMFLVCLLPILMMPILNILILLLVVFILLFFSRPPFAYATFGSGLRSSHPWGV